MSYRLVLLAIIFMSFSTEALSQFEVRMNALGFLQRNLSLSVEKQIGTELSLELQGGSDNGIFFDTNGNNIFISKISAYKFRLFGKYFYNPKRGGDRWFTSVFLSNKRYTTSDRFGFSSAGLPDYTQFSILSGVGFGYKWATKSGFTIEISTGYGRSIYSHRKNSTFDTGNKERVKSQDSFFDVSLGYRFISKKNNP